MDCACSVLSLAIRVRLLISYLLFCCRSFKESSKSDATSEPAESEPLGDRAVMTSSRGQRGSTSTLLIDAI